VSQGKKNDRLSGAVGQPALIATRTRWSMSDFIGRSLAYRLSANRNPIGLKGEKY
jgi:hypothetical protein